MDVAKETDVTERRIHTGGEQIQGNKTRKFRHRAENRRKGRGGGQAGQHKFSSLGQGPTMSPGSQGSAVCSSAACSTDVSAVRSADVSAARIADVSDPGTARLRGSGLLAPWHHMATAACLMPASLYLRVARKRKFSTLSLRSAVENGSFSSVWNT